MAEVQIICCPLVDNVPEPRHNWELINCPVCNAECWLSENANALIEMGPEMYKLACTNCALGGKYV